MKRGKYTCRILKDIRRQIAEANGIEFVTSECRFKGDCLGTCPKCEAEIRYLEEELRRKSLSGKAVAIAGISAGMLIMGGCSPTSAKASAETSSEITSDTISTVLTDSVISEATDTAEFLNGTKMKGKGLQTEVNTKESTSAKPVIIRSGAEVIVEERPYGFDVDEYDTDRIFEVVEERPTFPGGDKALLGYLKDNIRYPKDVHVDKDVVRTVLWLVIKKDGQIGDIKVMRSLGPEFDNEAIRVVKTLPRFSPGRMRGKPVNSYYTLAVSFYRPVSEK
ncbi:MAG: energy transducer TonB [Duncaniella sp.]|nr:energy transducer TonB [Duncaniella sp.]